MVVAFIHLSLFKCLISWAPGTVFTLKSVAACMSKWHKQTLQKPVSHNLLNDEKGTQSKVGPICSVSHQRLEY